VLSRLKAARALTGVPGAEEDVAKWEREVWDWKSPVVIVVSELTPPGPATCFTTTVSTKME
jgi:hypothetical protein